MLRSRLIAALLVSVFTLAAPSAQQQPVFGGLAAGTYELHFIVRDSAGLSAERAVAVKVRRYNSHSPW